MFLGDLVDRGPRIPDVLKLVMAMVEAETAYCVPGNHDMKLVRQLRGRDVRLTHGLAESVAQLEAESPEFRKRVADFLDDLVSHYVFDDGKLVVAHAGMKEEMQGRGSGKVRAFAHPELVGSKLDTTRISREEGEELKALIEQRWDATSDPPAGKPLTAAQHREFWRVGRRSRI